ncbi:MULTISPECIES: phage head completion protein [Catenuloplanes]|uniref:Head-tail adaptor n=1 Tax=Catenuloplanes niger TaxID=587534 RepID=A0AAE3ZSK3_9ACTN|nr:head-tail adaptor protein [Catenuloplanes niger]MDR7323378.1 head-tail adaptor [Catenuloplanes niger]
MQLRDRITRLRAPLIADGYGNQGPDWPAAVTAVLRASVQPASSTEDVVDEQRTVTRWRVWLPRTADLLATDRIEWDGQTYEVEGDVEHWKDRGQLHHLEAVMIKVTQG